MSIRPGSYVVDQIRLLVFLLVFGLLHTIVLIIDLTIVRAVRVTSRFLTKHTGFPPAWLFASARPLTRHTQIHGGVGIHVQSPAKAHAWFGWPIVVPRSRLDENPLGSADAAESHLFRLRSPIYTNHVSTIVANFKSVPNIKYRREIVQSFDGCDLCVDWAYPEDNTHLFDGPIHPILDAIAGVARALGQIDETFTRFGIPPQHGLSDRKFVKGNHIGVMSIVPGLMSDSSTTYLRSLIRVALMHGFVVAMVHTRGIATPLTRPKMFHGGFTEDVRHWVYNFLSKAALEKRFGQPTKACIVGISIGANVLGNFLAEDGDKVAKESAVVCATAISAPWMFRAVKEPMGRFIQKVTYDADFRSGLVHYVKYNAKALRDPVTGRGVNFDYEKALKIKDVPDFDENVIVPHHGYPDKYDYYDSVSCFPKLPQVTMPLICVSVADDPICPAPSEPEWKKLCEKTPNILWAELPGGGHLGCLGSPMEELTLQPTALEALVCRSMAHFLVHLSQGTQLDKPMHSDF